MIRKMNRGHCGPLSSKAEEPRLMKIETVHGPDGTRWIGVDPDAPLATAAPLALERLEEAAPPSGSRSRSA